MSISILHGSDRNAMMLAAKTKLGEDYEIFEADSITVADMDSIFLGQTLFDGDEKRHILLKDLNDNKDCFAKLPDYVSTEHEVVVIASGKLNKTFAYVKEVLDCEGIESKEFETIEERTRDKFENFEPIKQALAGHGKIALKKLELLKDHSAAPLVMGSMCTQVAKLLDGKDVAKGVKAMKILARADMMSKRSGIDMWMPIEWALLEIANL
jgi:hypothetical protein